MVCPAISSYTGYSFGAMNSFNNLYDVYTHNGGVHVHRILIFIKYLIMTGSWTSNFFMSLALQRKVRGGGGGFLSNIHKMTGSWTSFPSYNY